MVGPAAVFVGLGALAKCLRPSHQVRDVAGGVLRRRHPRHLPARQGRGRLKLVSQRFCIFLRSLSGRLGPPRDFAGIPSKGRCVADGERRRIGRPAQATSQVAQELSLVISHRILRQRLLNGRDAMAGRSR